MTEGSTEDRHVTEYDLMPQGEVLQAFSESRSRNSMIMGPLGSGKTVQAILKFLDLMCEQEPVKRKTHQNYNKRLSRIIACRNTYSELFSTTIKDWLEIHGDLGVFKQGSKSPPTHYIDFDLEDGTSVNCEVIFIAFDRPDHVKKARGIQTTWVWLNETKELSKAVIDMLDLRHGRYPSLKEGIQCTHHGMVGDYNAPFEGHWLYELAENTKPKDWEFFRQPGGVLKKDGKWVVNNDAENITNLPHEYYDRGLQGKSDDWIHVNLANEYGFVTDGKPVHPWYVDSTHCRHMDEWVPDITQPIVLGFDFGRTPACAFVQRVEFNRWVVFDEFLADDMGAVEFAPALKKYIDYTYPHFKFRGWGDPSGSNRNQANAQTPFMILRASGIPCNPTQSNDPLKRRASLEVPMKELCMDGRPRFVLLPKAKMIRRGLQGGFCYRLLQKAGEHYTEEPDKNEYSHPVEALEYALQGEGEGRSALINKSRMNKKPVFAPVKFNVFG